MAMADTTKSVVYKIFGGHPAPAGRALPNLINAVKMLKSKPHLF